MILCHSHSKGFTAYNSMLNSYHQGLEPNRQTKGPALIQKFNLQIKFCCFISNTNAFPFLVL